jgi:Lipid A 3-O-deacylase (PagL)
VVSGLKSVTLPFYVVGGLLLAVDVARAQVVVRGATEWSATAAVASGITFLQSTGGQRFVTAQVSAARVLTDLRGPRWLRGRFEWGVEVVPVFAEWSSGTARGAGVAPLQWRWNFSPRGRLHPFAEVGGGALWTSASVPAGTTGSNFTSHAGVGVRVLGRGGAGLVVGYRLHHISNGNRLRRNPGVNAHMLQLGWTMVRRP